MTGRIVHIPDALSDSEYTFKSGQKIVGYRTGLGVPLMREGTPIGVLILWRSHVRPFTDKQIQLVATFADQAVIAIENTRLLNELRQRTDNLSEALEQQTASSEVLEIISSSPGELEPVFKTILQNATRICAASFGNLYLHDGATSISSLRTMCLPHLPIRAAGAANIQPKVRSARSLEQKNLLVLPILPRRGPILIANNGLWKPSNLVACGPQLRCLF